ncbi:MAG: biliverdin-producing heme oxygenase [Rhizobiales bacterium]|nr:biliverdin-producing heme oxygenase [Hyphomicrobiales bacterium]MBO6697223.1 biliverdin-producing heme oxygenase [Hyphomicrobiales bacterium]MBO6736522.1 biliverdin-producing heme oxygenase [Hyphomicrobiales bacterium]MBO6912992.1 biliverdin-producing heme oxygenase [Hyphomicrobiales bacterium]MBO6954160.1 biliverdin-producing heme oxygenase [Hyphomicrobiales bacterium]
MTTNRSPTSIQQRTKGLRARLADETRVLHEALHHHPRLLPLASGRITEMGLATLITDYWTFYATIEAQRAKFGWCAPVDLVAPTRALASDRTAMRECFSVSPPPVHLHTLPTSGARCLGALYVMLGAQFGGRVLGQELAKALPDVRSTYFAPCQDSLGAWRLLLSRLEDIAPLSAEANAVVHGALTTFRGLAGLLDQRSVPTVDRFSDQALDRQQVPALAAAVSLG